MNFSVDTVALLGSLEAWLFAHGLSIFFILAAVFVVRLFAGVFLEKVIRKAVRGTGNTRDERMREDTLIHISVGVVRVLVWLVAALMILSEAGVNIGPLLAAAGVAGIAIGFGGQYLIRDVVAGMFIILENQYRVGDVVCLDDTCGLVESVGVRTVTLRDLDGTVHHVPHGGVGKVSNLSKHFARVNLNVGVAYTSGLEQVEQCINRIGQELTEDPKWKEDIIAAPKFERVNAFGDSAIEVKILGDTKPLRQWAVTGELRKRLKIAFDKEGIEIPFPQRVIHQGK